jgi:hypothetical protein
MSEIAGRVVRAAIALLVMLAVALMAVPALAERTQSGNLIAYLNGRVSPRTLPRDHLAPVAAHLDAGIRTSAQTPLPRVTEIRLELAWRGTLDTTGLMSCARKRLLSVDTRHAMQACGPALVGKGKIFARVFLPNQEPFGLHATLLAFNGKTKSGEPTVWVLAYSADPPGSVVIPFYVKHQPGPLHTVLVGVIPRSVGSWPHFAHFHMVISRRFAYRGRSHSYMSASCPLPPRFTSGLFLLARATFTTTDAPALTAETQRTCRAR